MWQNCNDLLIEWYSFVATAARKQCSRGIPRQWPYSVLMTYGYKNTFTVIESQLRRITAYHFGKKDISYHHIENGYIVGLKRTPNLFTENNGSVWISRNHALGKYCLHLTRSNYPGEYINSPKKRKQQSFWKTSWLSDNFIHVFSLLPGYAQLSYTNKKKNTIVVKKGWVRIK